MIWPGPTRSQFLLWVLVCALAELLGIGIGAGWWIGMDQLNPEPTSTAAKWISLFLKSLSGVVEGAVLGTLQALVLRRIYPRLPVRKWIALTVGLAVLGWAVGSGIPLFANFSGPQPEPLDPPLGWTLLASGLMGLLLGTLFGAVQMIAFQEAAENTHIWIVVNALGWGIALPIIYAAASIGSPDMSLQSMLLQAVVAGSLAGVILGSITGTGMWRIVPRLE